ncbi:MAG: hypothetical protein IPJ34_13455 [Myxococcales bacterium]|nr:hypothetical protein [Myxococcales bacterium]
MLVLEPGEGGADLGLDGAIVALRLRGSELKRLRQALRNRLAEEAARVLGQRRRGKDRKS